MQNWLSNTYLGKLYRFNKILFLFILLFLAGNICCNLLKIEITPMLWGLFSEKQDVQNTYQVIEVVVNDSAVLDYSKGYHDANRFFLISPLTFYVDMKQHHNIDPTLRNPPHKLKLYFPAVMDKLKSTCNDSSNTMLSYNGMPGM